MKAETSIKLAIVAVVLILFAGIILRAAIRLAATAMHSLFGMLLIVVLVIVMFAKRG